MTEKISIITDEISQDLGECEAFLEEHDLHAVELRCIGGERVPALGERDRGRLREWSRRGDPYLVAISPGLFKCHVDDTAEIERHLLEVLPASLDLLFELGGENLISFTFEGGNRQGLPAQALDALSVAAEQCSEAGVPLLLENEPGFLASTAAEMAALIRAVGHPGLFVNWDPCNSNQFTGAELFASTERVVPYLRNVHVKNGVLAPGERFARCGPLSEGEIDWPGHLAHLFDTGYEGFLCLETHFLPRRESSEVILAELRGMLASIGSTWPEEA
jgi:L-ribulose-5-phosphate 3-epimerase